MGDVAMTVPVIRAFVAQNPHVEITFVSRSFFKPFFENCKNVHFFDVDLKVRHKGFIGLLKLFFDLKRLNIDAFVDLHNVLRSKIVRTLFALSGTKTAFTNKGRKEKKQLTRANNKVFKPLKTMIDRHVETFAKLGFFIDLGLPHFVEKTILSDEILSVSGSKNDFKWIGIAPFAQYQSKVYPTDLMQHVIDGLAVHPQNKIFLFGGGTKEIEILNQFAKQNVNVIVIAGALNLQNELCLISNLDVMLSMDSGNAHIAAMLHIPVVTLWGATHPYAGFAPFNQPLQNCITSDKVLYPLLPTSVYGNKFVAGYENVMRTISAAHVINKVTSFLQ